MGWRLLPSKRSPPSYLGVCLRRSACNPSPACRLIQGLPHNLLVLPVSGRIHHARPHWNHDPCSPVTPSCNWKLYRLLQLQSSWLRSRAISLWRHLNGNSARLQSGNDDSGLCSLHRSVLARVFMRWPQNEERGGHLRNRNECKDVRL